MSSCKGDGIGFTKRLNGIYGRGHSLNCNSSGKGQKSLGESGSGTTLFDGNKLNENNSVGLSAAPSIVVIMPLILNHGLESALLIKGLEIYRRKFEYLAKRALELAISFLR